MEAIMRLACGPARTATETQGSGVTQAISGVIRRVRSVFTDGTGPEQGHH